MGRKSIWMKPPLDRLLEDFKEYQVKQFIIKESIFFVLMLFAFAVVNMPQEEIIADGPYISGQFFILICLVLTVCSGLFFILFRSEAQELLNKSNDKTKKDKEEGLNGSSK